MPLRIGYIFTSFPKYSETFLMREIDGMAELPEADVELFSCLGGSGTHYGRFPLRHLRWWHWCLLPITALREAARRPDLLRQGLRLYAGNPPKSWTNAAEQLLGVAFALSFAGRFRRSPPDALHASWATAPATAAALLRELTGIPYSMGAHAYDLYRKGGDCLLKTKIRRARWIHTTSIQAEDRLCRLGARPEQVHVIRRGLGTIPPCKPDKPIHGKLRLLSVGRFVEKKGYFEQLHIYRALMDCGLDFSVRIVGDGPLLRPVRRAVRRLRLEGHVRLLGKLPYERTAECYDWADFFIFTGKIAPDGDRDGFPNVLGEAMASGVIVLSTSVAATPEVIRPGRTGELLPIDQPNDWAHAIRRLARDHRYRAVIRANACRWIEEDFDAKRNAARLFELHKTFFTA